MYKFVIILLLTVVLPVTSWSQKIDHNFYSIGVSGGAAFITALDAYKDDPNATLENGVAFGVSPLYHFSPSAINLSLHIGLSAGYHSSQFVDRDHIFGTLRSTELMILAGIGKYPYSASGGFIKFEVGAGEAITDFKNGSYMDFRDGYYGMTTKVATDNVFVLSLSLEGGLFISKSFSISAQLLELVENVGNRWTETANNKTVPLNNLGDFQASTTQFRLSLRYWGGMGE